MNIKMRCYRILTKLFRGHNLDRYPSVMKIHNYFVKKISNEYINVNGYKMIAGMGDWLHFQYTGEYEPLTTKLVSEMIKPGDIVVDVGANIGYYTLLFSRIVGKMGMVYAFEPEPTNFSFLIKNIELNGYKNIISIQNAVSDVSGFVKLYLHETNPGGHTITDAYENLKSIDVQCITLETYFKGHQHKPDFIKIDVEGAEDRVLKGAGSLIDGNTNIVLEFNTDVMNKTCSDYDALFKNLIEKGYCFTGINEKDRTRKELNKDDLYSLKYTHRGRTINILCTKKFLPHYPIRDKTKGGIKMTCENCKYSELMHLSPASDRMLCKRHQVDVIRTHRCRDFRNKKDTKRLVCPNCKKTLIWPRDQDAGDCIYCEVYFKIGYPPKRVSDEF